MSKKELKHYLHDLTKEQLEEQIMDLYGRFREVKTFYDFIFQPREERLLEDAKFRITKEYFPLTGRKAKARRSVAQKLIRHFIQLGVDPHIVADIMLYNIEVAQQFARERKTNQQAFYKSILKSFQEAVQYIGEQQLLPDLSSRLDKIVAESKSQHWMNLWGFEDAVYAIREENSRS